MPAHQPTGQAASIRILQGQPTAGRGHNRSSNPEARSKGWPDARCDIERGSYQHYFHPETGHRRHAGTDFGSPGGVDNETARQGRRVHLKAESHANALRVIGKTEGLDTPTTGNIQPFPLLSGCAVAALLADSEYFRAAGWTDALSCRSLVLHDDALGVPDFLLSTALHAVCLHMSLLSSHA
jgi:hypothetical protein